MTTPSYSFSPDASRACLLDARMHHGLRDSLGHVVDVLEERGFEETTWLRERIARLDDGERQTPLAFHAYYQLTEAVFSDDLPRLKHYASLLHQQPGRTPAQRRDPWQPGRRPSHAEYASSLCAGNIGLALDEPEERAWLAFDRRLCDARMLAADAVPDLLAEHDALVFELIGFSSRPGQALQIDGASHFQLWGSLFLNVAFHRTPVALIEVLAHETAHSLLFGFCTESPLVLNDDDACYASPLRPDPRPMDGIYHATFVTARMQWAMAGLLQSGLLDAMQRDEASSAMRQNALNFWAGYRVIREHGELTSHGASLIEAARDFMASLSPEPATRQWQAMRTTAAKTRATSTSMPARFETTV